MTIDPVKSVVASPDLLGEVNLGLVLYDQLDFVHGVEGSGQRHRVDRSASGIKHCGWEIVCLENCWSSSIAICIS